jgi:hypothetical protein
MAEAKTSARRISAAERRRKALSLRLAGATFEQIARAPTSADNPAPLYSSRKRAHEAVNKALDEIASETRGTAEQLRTLELARLEAMQASLWPSTRPTKPVTVKCTCGREVTMHREPDHDAIDRVIKIMERRARYLGLDAGGKADQTNETDEARSMLAGVAAGLQQVYDEIAAEDAAAADHQHGDDPGAG